MSYGTDPAGNAVPVMHACGHDMHVTALIGALERLVATRDERHEGLVGEVREVFPHRPSRRRSRRGGP